MGSRKRILVVDDDERVLFILHDALKKLGQDYEVVAARQGSEALDEASRAFFDLLITDLRMPGMDGAELTKAIKTLSAGTVVIWITAYGCQKTYADAERLGVYLCLDKPVEVTAIRRVVLRALDVGERLVAS